MALITIREKPVENNILQASVIFPDGGEYPVSFTNPFSQKEEENLTWYFEEHLKHPFMNEGLAKTTGDSIKTYGEALFNQIFTEKVLIQYSLLKSAGIHTIQFEIKGSTDYFHQIHWEAMKDPNLPHPFVYDCIMTRCTFKPPLQAIHPNPSPTLNILLVTSRPNGKHDVAYRTISRPLVEAVQSSQIPVKIDILRPGTYQALSTHLQDIRDTYGAGYYHIIHFDVHGGVLSYQELTGTHEPEKRLFQTRFGRTDLEPFKGKKAFIFLNGEGESVYDPVEDKELADLLMNHSIPVVILNACQSGMLTGENQSSMGNRLIEAGVRTVLAMSYSITATAARQMMETLYTRLVQKNDLFHAIRWARARLLDQKSRDANFRYTIDLEDWVLPVLYHRIRPDATSPFPIREMTFEEREEFLQQNRHHYFAPKPRYGFVGRDLDILEIERKLLNTRDGAPHNLLLVRGMGGAGKTTLLTHLAEWWQKTGFISEVCYFGYDEKPWTLDTIINLVAKKVYGVFDDTETNTPEYREFMMFRTMKTALQVQELVRMLRNSPHLLILDNLESVTGEDLAIPNPLSGTEQEKIRKFLQQLKGGKTMVLLGSRGGVSWLIKEHDGALLPEDIYDLSGLDQDAASDLANKVLERHVTDSHRRTRLKKDENFLQLLKILAGYPLAIEVILSNLKTRETSEILEALQIGDISLDTDTKSKTESLIQCIDYSYSNLSSDAQTLLLLLAPFSGVILENGLEPYFTIVKSQPGLESIYTDNWENVITSAKDWGLLSSTEIQGFLKIQPVLPYFLKNKLSRYPDEFKKSIDIGFYLHYQKISLSLCVIIFSKENKEIKFGLNIVKIEYENLINALEIGLNTHRSVLPLYSLLSKYLKSIHDLTRGFLLAQRIRSILELYPHDLRIKQFHLEYWGVVSDIALYHVELNHLQEAEETYLIVLNICDQTSQWPKKVKEKNCATVYHELGRVYQKQRNFEKSEQNYLNSLEIYDKYDDDYELGGTLFQLGTMFQDQGNYEDAKNCYLESLEIFINLDEKNGLAKIYRQLSQLALNQGNFEEAKQNLSKEIKILRENNELYELAGAYNNLGNLFQEQDEFELAEEFYRKSLEIKVFFKDRYFQTSTYHQLGLLFQKKKDFIAAEQNYLKELEILNEFNDCYNQAKAYHQLGRVAENQDKFDEARTNYLMALEYITGFDDTETFNIIFSSIARLYQTTGDQALVSGTAQILSITESELKTRIQSFNT